MNAVVGNIEPAEPAISAIDQVHIWRSKFLDYSARCETRLRVLHTNNSQKSEIFLQIKALAASVKSEGKGCLKLTSAIDELMPLIELRAELAHSVVTLLNFNSQQTAVFVNADNKSRYGRHALILGVDEREAALKKIKNIAERLKRYQKTQFDSDITPPSSPPPPKQGATTCP